MIRSVILTLFAAAVLASSLAAQTPAAVPASAAACLPSTTLDEMIKALDAAVSGPADKDRACLRELLLPEARLAPIAKAEDGSFAPHLLTIDGWVDAVRKRGNVVLNEHQIRFPSDVYGHIAHLWSTYELRTAPGGPPQVRGINSIQAVNDGTRWRILEVLWQAETPDAPIPAKYLP